MFPQIVRLNAAGGSSAGQSLALAGDRPIIQRQNLEAGSGGSVAKASVEADELGAGRARTRPGQCGRELECVGRSQIRLAQKRHGLCPQFRRRFHFVALTDQDVGGLPRVSVIPRRKAPLARTSRQR